MSHQPGGPAGHRDHREAGAPRNRSARHRKPQEAGRRWSTCRRCRSARVPARRAASSGKLAIGFMTARLPQTPPGARSSRAVSARGRHGWRETRRSAQHFSVRAGISLPAASSSPRQLRAIVPYQPAPLAAAIAAPSDDASAPANGTPDAPTHRPDSAARGRCPNCHR